MFKISILLWTLSFLIGGQASAQAVPPIKLLKDPKELKEIKDPKELKEIKESYSASNSLTSEEILEVIKIIVEEEFTAEELTESLKFIKAKKYKKRQDDKWNTLLKNENYPYNNLFWRASSYFFSEEKLDSELALIVQEHQRVYSLMITNPNSVGIKGVSDLVAMQYRFNKAICSFIRPDVCLVLDCMCKHHPSG